ncbi:MAG: hypothetical protein AB1733_11160 [Thermodesulfobacteriota bacterium]
MRSATGNRLKALETSELTRNSKSALMARPSGRTEALEKVWLSHYECCQPERQYAKTDEAVGGQADAYCRCAAGRASGQFRNIGQRLVDTWP